MQWCGQLRQGSYAATALVISRGLSGRRSLVHRREEGVCTLCSWAGFQRPLHKVQIDPSTENSRDFSWGKDDRVLARHPSIFMVCGKH